MVDHPLDCVLEHENVEIDQKSYLRIQQAEVRQQLRLIDGMKAFFAFDFDYDFIVDHEVGTKPALPFDSLVNEWDGLLPMDPKPLPLEFVG
jgi:hypothetical protein